MKTNHVMTPGHRRLLQAAGARAGTPREPVAVGALARTKDFDAGTAVFGKPMTAAEVRRTLGPRS